MAAKTTTDYTVKLYGKKWKIYFLPPEQLDGKLGIKLHGVCCRKKREIYINDQLKGKQLTDALVHEMLHGAIWLADEEWVVSVASSIAKALHKIHSDRTEVKAVQRTWWKLFWRKKKKDRP